MNNGQIDLKSIPERIASTIYERGNVSIDMTVDTRDGVVLFEGYINGEYIPFSRDRHVFSTVRVVNNQLSLVHKENTT